jgi:hypothetical protein
MMSITRAVGGAQSAPKGAECKGMYFPLIEIFKVK